MDNAYKKRRMALKNKYEFVRVHHIDEETTRFGFECGNGWIPILEDLFAKINEEVKTANLAEFRVTQVKEKFGDLVVTVKGGNNAIDTLIGLALKKAAKTCEGCGKPGQNRESNEWFSTQCSKCYNERIDTQSPFKEKLTQKYTAQGAAAHGQ